jgi:hypothetical protein
MNRVRTHGTGSVKPGYGSRIRIRKKKSHRSGTLIFSHSVKNADTTLIEMLGEFFLIYDEGRRCKVIYDGKFPGFSINMTKISILAENSPQIFPICDENLRTRKEVPLDFP